MQAISLKVTEHTDDIEAQIIDPSFDTAVMVVVRERRDAAVSRWWDETLTPMTDGHTLLKVVELAVEENSQYNDAGLLVQVHPLLDQLCYGVEPSNGKMPQAVLFKDGAPVAKWLGTKSHDEIALFLHSHAGLAVDAQEDADAPSHDTLAHAAKAEYAASTDARV